jgi:hypothetical protein
VSMSGMHREVAREPYSFCEVDNGQAVHIRGRLSRPLELKLGTWMNPVTVLVLNLHK